MWIGNMHINIVKGDYKFACWEPEAYKEYRKKIHELRCAGYRKVGIDHDYLNYYEFYKRKNKKKIITVTLMEC